MVTFFIVTFPLVQLKCSHTYASIPGGSTGGLSLLFFPEIKKKTQTFFILRSETTYYFFCGKNVSLLRKSNPIFNIFSMKAIKNINAPHRKLQAGIICCLAKEESPWKLFSLNSMHSRHWVCREASKRGAAVKRRKKILFSVATKASL